MFRWTAVVLTALLGAMLALPAASQWKWRDKSGQVQYSDLPPPSGVAERDVLQKPDTAVQRRAPAPLPAASAASGPPLLATKTVEPELEAKRHKAEQEEAAKKKAEEDRLSASRAENCARAKGHLRALDEGMRMARTNDKGEREILDDKGRAEETKRARDVVASDCK